MDELDCAPPSGTMMSQSHWYDTWDRQDSQSFSNTAKGLRNAPGENNCFLNSAVQVFWHIDVFRRSYRRLSGHLCMGHSCIFCALKVIFTQFQYSDQASLQPSALRKALANTFAKQERFQLGHMDDAAECFENILRRIHFHIANEHNEDTCNAPHCVSHQKFAMTVFDQLVCPCGASSDPLTFHEIVHYISANALVSQSRMMQESGDVLHPDRFGLLLRNAGAVGDVRDCPQNCGKRVQIRRTLLNVPDVVSIGLVWGSDRPDMELTTEVAQTIGTRLLLPDIFHSVMCKDKDVNKLPRLQLTAMVCYYGKHYSTFIWHTKLNSWIYFDDATVKEIGPRWEHVVDKCVRGRYQPLLLIYCNPDAAPVPTETAPSTRVMAPGYSVKGNNESESQPEPMLQPDLGKGRSTPNLEGGDPSKVIETRKQTIPTQDTEKESLSRKSSFEHRRQSSFLIAVSSKPTVNIRNNRNGQPGENPGYVNQGSNLSTQMEEGYSENVPCSRNNSMKSGTGYYNSSSRQCEPTGQDMTDSYNYTLSTSDQYRRPGVTSPDPNKLPLTLNFSRANDVQRKESFKKGKGKVTADVIRFKKDSSRRTSTSSESDPNTSPTYPECRPGQEPITHSNKQQQSQPPLMSRSQSCDDHLCGPTSDNSNNPQHKVVKPKPSTPTVYENMEEMGRSHTPVQSGLATLPRKKPGHNKLHSQIDLSHSRPCSIKDTSAILAAQSLYCNYPLQQDSLPGSGQYQNVAPVSGPDTDLHSRQSSTSSILSQSTVVECTPQGDSKSPENNKHWRQSSSVSQDGGSNDKPKDVKNKSNKRKEEKRSKTKRDKVAGKPPTGCEKSVPDEGFSEAAGKKFYIDSRMVESVLSFQKLQRSGSVVSQTSTSSVESDSYHMKGIKCKESLSNENSFDTVSVDSHKDSGYGSSDRNSSSSTGSITMNPYEQYFLSRSMIPPKTVNPVYNVAEGMRKMMGPGGHMGMEYTQEKDLRGLVTNPNENYHNTHSVQHCQQGSPYHPDQTQIIRDPNYDPKDDRNLQVLNAINKRCKPVSPPQVPNKPQPSVGEQHNPSKPAYPAGPDGRNGYPAAPMQGPSVPQGGPPNYQNQVGNPIPNPNDQSSDQPSSPPGIAHGNEQFIGLCQKAEDLMDQCVLAETSEEFGQALQYCQHATEQLKGAMRLPNISSQSYDYASRKSNSCILKLRSLQKKLLLRQESNTSSKSSDGNPLDHRNMKGQGQGSRGQSSRLSNPSLRPPSRSGSQTSMDSIKDGSSSGSSSGSARSGTPVHMQQDHRTTQQQQQQQQRPQMDRSFETNTPDKQASNSAEIYGTLPRRQTQKSADHTRMCNNQVREAEVYQSFLEKQKQNSNSTSSPQISHSRSSSGALTPVNMLDSECIEQNMRQQMTSQTVKTGHADIRQISQNSSINRCVQQRSGPNVSSAPFVEAPQQQFSKPGPPQHSEVGSKTKRRPAPPVKSAWLQQGQPGGSPHGNVVVSKLPVTSSPDTVCIQTAYSDNVVSVATGRCTAVVDKGGANTLLSPQKSKQIERSASFSHTKPSHSTNYLNYHARQSDIIGGTMRPERVSTNGPRLTSRNGASQPDLRSLCMEEPCHSSRPTTPQTLPADTDFRPSVRSLASRFEYPSSSSNRTVTDNTDNTRATVTAKRDRCRSSSCVSLQRQRSKSESEFLAPKPKSALSKKGKGGKRPRKSVTFSANICLVAAMDSLGLGPSSAVDGIQDGYQSDEEGMSHHYNNNVDDTDDSSGSADSPVEVTGDGACDLCHKKGVEVGHNFCSKCEFYMSKFMSSQ